jgi:hypothetical protein
MTQIVAVFGPDGNDRVDDQIARLAADLDGARERDVGYLAVRRGGAPASFRLLADVRPDEFVVVLIGHDRTEKQRWTEPVDAATVWAAIDALPEQRERRRRAR